jgi:alpha-mannosidase
MFRELLVLLPCHSFEDFPTHHKGEEADGLLAGWSAMWHPALLAASEAPPNWRRVDDPPQELERRLLIVPAVCVSRLPTGYLQRAKESGAVVIRKGTDRHQMVRDALAGLATLPSEDNTPAEGPPGDWYTAPLYHEIVCDFMALGWAYLQVTLLTRQMRYSASLDDTYFRSQAVSAAKCAAAGELDAAREKLSSCFSLLAEEKDRYYPVDAHVIDLTFVAESTLGESLRREIQSLDVHNLMLTARDLEQCAKSEPESFKAIERGINLGRIGLIGGDYSEDRAPLLSVDENIANLKRGLETYDRLIKNRPLVYGRRRFGLIPSLPATLLQFGYKGAVHAGFEDGAVPEGVQLKVRWEGSDGTAIDAIARPPLDANESETFLSFASKLGQSMDQDHVATVVLAHWPSQSSVWYDDLRRTCSYCSALGRMTTIDRYFAETPESGHLERFETKQYRSPFLKQAVIRNEIDPISTVIRYWREYAARNALSTITTLSGALSGEPPASTTQADATQNSEGLQQAIERAAEKLARQIVSSPGTGEESVLAINPQSCVRRTGILTGKLSRCPAIAKPIYSAADASQGRSAIVADIPAMGFVWIEPGKSPSKPDRPLVEENILLRNEFFEAKIDQHSGGLFGIFDYGSRANRMSQRIGLRTPGGAGQSGEAYRDPDEAATYSVMAADSIETTISTTTLGEVVAKGRLLDQNGKAHGRFTQTYRIWRGSRVLGIEIELSDIEELKADPWNSYYCARWAWSDEAAELHHSVHQQRHPASGKRIEAPHYVDVVSVEQNTTILTGGLPFHRRQGLRGLDSILVVRGERERKFQLGIGVDLKTPLHEANDLLGEPIVTAIKGKPPAAGNTAYLNHIDVRNVIASNWSCVVEDGRVAGMRVRLIETLGRSVEAKLSLVRTPKKADRINGLGETIESLEIADGKVVVPLRPHGWAEIEARW